MALIDTVYDDIQKFLGTRNATNARRFMNERDLQMHLVIALKNTNHYDNVDLEYYVPLNALGDEYVWKTEMKVDIVVEKDGEFIPIELKYKTKAINEKISRFGEKLKQAEIVKDQSAHNIAKYAFWKDVRRIELLKKRFKAVTGGVSLFLTNDPIYQIAPRPGTKSFTHSIANGKHSPKRESLDKYTEFTLNKEYTIQWSATFDKNASKQFEYILLKV